MEVTKTALGELCLKTCSGGTPKSTERSFYEPATIPWLTTSEVNYSRIYSTKKGISVDGLNNSSAKLIPENSVIVAMYGQGNTAGRVAINKIPLSTNQACCNLRIDPTKADYKYVYYALCASYDKLVALKNGGAQPNLNAAKVKSFEIPTPTIEVQRAIGRILSAYDDMIDNCKRQITLLEEAAQRLYREWFSEFSPNAVLYKLAEDVGQSEKKSNRTNYECYTPIDCLPKKSLAYIAPKDISLAESSLKSYKPKDILFGAMRVYFHKVCIAQEYGLTRSTCIVINAIRKEYWAYLTLLMFREETIAWATANSKEGTTMPYISWEKLKYMPVYLPNDEVAKQFNVIAETYLTRIIVLAKYIRNLIEIKNLLLPRQISGQIEINA